MGSIYSESEKDMTEASMSYIFFPIPFYYKKIANISDTNLASGCLVRPKAKKIF